MLIRWQKKRLRNKWVRIRVTALQDEGETSTAVIQKGLMEPLADCVQNLILIEKWNKRILQLYKKRRLSRQSDMWKYADGKTNHGNEWRGVAFSDISETATCWRELCKEGDSNGLRYKENEWPKEIYIEKGDIHEKADMDLVSCCNSGGIISDIRFYAL